MIPRLCTLSLLALTASLPGQLATDVLIDPGYCGSTQYAEWEFFSYAMTTPNEPDVAGDFATIAQVGGTAIITSSANIYSPVGDMAFRLLASAPQPLGRIHFQIRVLGQEEAILSMKLLLDGGATELEPVRVTEIYREEFDAAFGDSVDLVMAYEWDLQGRSVTSYEIAFDLLIHASLDQVRLDTTDTLPYVAPEITSAGFESGVYTLRFPTVAGQTYQVKWADSPGGPWDNTLGSTVLGDGSEGVVTDPDATTIDRRFYILYSPQPACP